MFRGFCICSKRNLQAHQFARLHRPGDQHLASPASFPMRHADFDQRLASLDALPVHRGRLMRVWLQGQPLDQGTRRRDSQHFLPLALRNAVPALTAELDGLARVRSEHAGNDGSRLLVELADGQMVESVLLPRDGLCVSTQVGCAVGCRFCMTGKSGLIRQVTSMEILAQVVLARRMRAVKGGFHGHGRAGAQSRERARSHRSARHRGRHRPQEPGVLDGGRPARVRGAAPAAHQSRWRCRYTRPKGTARAPVAARARIAPEALVELGEQYARDTGYPIQYQWTLLKGVNDGDDRLDAIVRLLKGKYGVLNVIPSTTAWKAMITSARSRAHPRDRPQPAQPWRADQDPQQRRAGRGRRLRPAARSRRRRGAGGGAGAARARREAGRIASRHDHHRRRIELKTCVPPGPRDGLTEPAQPRLATCPPANPGLHKTRPGRL